MYECVKIYGLLNVASCDKSMHECVMVYDISMVMLGYVCDMDICMMSLRLWYDDDMIWISYEYDYVDDYGSFKVL